MCTRLFFYLITALGLTTGAAVAQEVRVGFLSTFTGSGALLGEEMKKGWELALEHLDGKLGGLKAVTIYGDDQLKPDYGINVVERMLQRDKVHFVVGPIWGNVLLAIKDRVLKSNAILVGPNSGPSQLAGRECSPYFFSTSWQGDQTAEAMGQLMNDEGSKKVVFMTPNYQGGKQVLRGFERFYKGEIADRILYPLGSADFQNDFAKIRARKPDAVVVFAPGNMGIAFMQQWSASGLAKDIKLYSLFVINHLTLPVIGEATLGSYFTDFWDADADFPANQRFVKGFLARYRAHPSNFAAQAYDAALLIDSGVRQEKGNLEDRDRLALAMRKADYQSIRGEFKFNINGFPIQNYYRFSVVKGADGSPQIKKDKLVFRNQKDAFYTECKLSRQ